MSQIQVTPGVVATGAGSIVREEKFAVETRATWASNWVRRKWLYPVNATDAVAPSLGQGRFEYTFGRLKRADKLTIARHAALDVLSSDTFIRLLSVNTTRVWWTGVIDSETLLPYGDRKGAGNQEFGSFGIGHVLQRAVIDWAQARNAAGSTVELDWVPVINGRSGILRGNRSAAVNADGVYEFYDEGGHLWSNLQAAQMVLYNYMPAGAPPIVLGGQYDVLDSMHDRVELDGRTVWDVLNDLIDRRKGVGFYPYVSGDTIVLYVYPILETSLTLGGVTIPSNTMRAALNIDQRIEILNCSIVRSNALRCDQITVRGNRILSCFTVAQADGTLADDWNASDESAYDAGGSSASDYGAMIESEQQNINDEIRASDRFDAVYSRQRVPRNWDGQAGNGAGGAKSGVLPVCSDAGEITVPSGAPFTPLDKEFEDFIPFEQNKDYTGAAPTPSNEPTYLPPLALVLDEEVTPRWHLVDDPGPAVKDAGGSADLITYPSALAIGIKASPQHVYAKDVFATPPAEPSATAATLKLANTLATVAMRTDSTLRVTVSRAGATNVLRTKSIRIPDAEYWYVAPGTVLGIHEDGTLKRVAGALVLRDDRSRLWEMAAAAMAWYGSERRAIFLTLRALQDFAQLGTLMESIVTANTELRANTIFTSRTWDFRARTTTMETAWSEFDWSEV